VLAAQHLVEFRVVGQAVHCELGALQAAVLAAELHAHEPAAAGDLQLGGRVQGDDRTVDDEGHPVAQFVGGGQFMGRPERRLRAARLEVGDDVADVARVDRVQTGGRGLVEEEQLGVV